MVELVPTDHDPFAAEQFVPPVVADWAKQAAGKDVDTIRKVAEPIINAVKAPGQALASTTPRFTRSATALP